MPKWRNGRRTRLKILRGQLHEGSTPSFGTSIIPYKIGDFLMSVGSKVLRGKTPKNQLFGTKVGSKVGSKLGV